MFNFCVKPLLLDRPFAVDISLYPTGLWHFRLGPRRTLGYLALPGMAALRGIPFILPLIFIWVCVVTKLSLVIFPVDRVCYCLFVQTSIQILVRVLTRGLGSYILIFAVFMPIWMSWLCPDRKVQIKSLSAAISLSFVSLALVALNRVWRTPYLVLRVWFFIDVQNGFHLFRQSGSASLSILATSPVHFGFAVG